MLKAQARYDEFKVEILSRHSQEIFVGIGAGTRLYRVAGTAVDGGRRPVEWSMVVKVLTLDQLDFQSISTDQSAWGLLEAGVACLPITVAAAATRSVGGAQGGWQPAKVGRIRAKSGASANGADARANASTSGR
jgi:hypothetical protein